VAKGKVKVKEHEKLDDANIELVMGLREQEKPITIKEACERLNIAQNGARLNKIFEEYKERKAEEKRRRAANRGKAASEYEISHIAEEYLSGESVKAIADQLYRSTEFVKRVISDIGVPQAQPGESYADFYPLPEQCVADSFEEGEFVWSSRDVAIAEIMKAMPPKDGVNVYRIWVHQRIDPAKLLSEDGKRYAHTVETGGGYFAHQMAYDLGSLKHLRKYNVDPKRAIK
jgi:hypothetical protein